MFTAEKLQLAQKAMTLQRWQSNAIEGIGRNRDERRLIPPLLFGLFLAHKAGKKVSKGEACKLMGIAHAGPTAPKYFAYLADLDLITIEDRPRDDRRKDFVLPTPHTMELVETELRRVASLLRYLITPQTLRQPSNKTAVKKMR